jgi:L-fucose mutarotase
MLKNIDPLLTPALLHVLASMGHGDEIVIADANFTAHSLAGSRPLVDLPGAGVRRAVRAVMTLLPLDQYVAQPVAYMHVGDQPPDYRSALQRDVIADLVTGGHATSDQCEAIERFAFYARVKHAFAIVHTGELQPYANFILKKGVISDALLP